MSVTTIKFNELDKYVENVYEAIVVIAKRAKQINNEQKRIIETEISLDEDAIMYNDEEDKEIEKGEELNYAKLPKPTTIALEELLSGQIKFEYLKKEEA